MTNRLNRMNRRHERSTSNAVTSRLPHRKAQTWNRYQGSGRGHRESERQDPRRRSRGHGNPQRIHPRSRRGRSPDPTRRRRVTTRVVFVASAVAEAIISEQSGRSNNRRKRAFARTTARAREYATHQRWYRDDQRYGDAASLRRLRERESATGPDPPPARTAGHRDPLPGRLTRQPGGVCRSLGGWRLNSDERATRNRDSTADRVR